MKKVILFAPVIAGSILFSCKPKETPPGPIPPLQPKFKVEFLAADYGTLKSMQVTGVVSTVDDTTAWLMLSVNGTEPTGALYMLYQKDDAKAVKWSAKTIKGSSYADTTTLVDFKTSSIGDYTYDIPNSINKAFKLNIPIRVRKDGTPKSDVFTLWLTKDGKSGEFKNPAKNLAYGVATVTINYTGEKLINNYETTLGNTSDTTGSLFSTMVGSNYKRAEANNATFGPTIDFLFNTTKEGFVFGSPFKTTTKGDSVDVNVAAGFDIDGPDDKINTDDDGFKFITNVTKIAEISTSDYDGITGGVSLAAIVSAKVNATSLNSVTFTNADNKAFAFMTKAGKLGVVKIIKATGTVGVAGQANLEIKVQR